MNTIARSILPRILCLVLTFSFSLTTYSQSRWESIILASDTWNYKTNGSPISFDFVAVNFNDSSWLSGPGGIGFGDGDDSTIISFTSVLKLRKTFTIDDTNVIERLLLDIDYDDGFIAYLNGIKIANSSNLIIDGGSVSLSSREATLYSGGLPDRYEIDKSLLVKGDNVLAIQINNFGDDLSAIPFLNAKVNSSNTIYREVPKWFVPPIESSDITSNLPIIIINTDGKDIPDEPKIVASMGIINNGKGSINKTSDAFTDYNGRIAIEIRGKSSQEFPKKSYQFETQDSNGENNNVSLLGFPKENDWILYGPYSDKSMLRNTVTFQLANRMGEYYASRTAYCELILNDTYQGIYVLMERIKRDKGRIDIANLNTNEISGDDVTGGYIFKVDKTDDVNLSTDGWSGEYFYQYVYPKARDIVKEQKDYISDFMNEAEQSIISTNYTNREVGYNKYLNAGSFVDFLLLNEVSMDVDNYRFSVFFHKKKDSNGGELYAGPIWDFNLGYGNVNYWPTYEEGFELWAYEILESTENRISWWKTLMQDPYFENLVYTRWQDLRSDRLSDENVIDLVDSLAGHINSGQERNYVKWPILGTYIWPNFDWEGNDYLDEVAYFKNWLLNRLAWMDDNMEGKLLTPVAEISLKTEDKSQVVISLQDDYFNHAVLDKKYFSLVNAPEGVTIDSVIWVNASQAILSLTSDNGSTVNSSFSVKIDNDILNGFNDLVTNNIQLSSTDDILLAEAKVKIYTNKNVIYIQSDRQDVLPNEIEVFSAMGQHVGVYKIERQYVNKIPLVVAPGIYFVQCNIGNKSMVQKVVIQN